MRTEDRVKIPSIRRRGRPLCRPSAVALALAILAIAGWAMPLRAQMPDIHQMSGIPRPDTSVPDSTVVVRVVRGSLTDNAVNQPVTLKSQTKSKTLNTDAQGHATFTAFPPGTIVQASTTLDGVQLTSQSFPVPGRGGAILMLVGDAPGASGAGAAKAIPGTVFFGGQSRIVIDPGDGDVQVFYLLDIINNEASPAQPASPLLLDMPPEGQGTALLQGSTAKATVNGNHIAVHGPFAPGETLLEVGTVISYDTGELHIAQTVPADLQQVAVVARRIGNLNFKSPQVDNQREVPDKGEVYVAGTGPELTAGTPLTITLTGLPFHSRFPLHVSLGLAIALGIIGIVAVVTARRPKENEVRAQRLAEQRERLFADLVALEEQHTTGGISDDRYRGRRAELLARLERIYGQIEDESGTGDPGIAA